MLISLILACIILSEKKKCKTFWHLQVTKGLQSSRRNWQNPSSWWRSTSLCARRVRNPLLFQQNYLISHLWILMNSDPKLLLVQCWLHSELTMSCEGMRYTFIAKTKHHTYTVDKKEDRIQYINSLIDHAQWQVFCVGSWLVRVGFGGGCGR